MKKTKNTRSLFECMECEYYGGLHKYCSYVNCGYCPTNNYLKFRTITDKKVDCPNKEDLNLTKI